MTYSSFAKKDKSLKKSIISAWNIFFVVVWIKYILVNIVNLNELLFSYYTVINTFYLFLILVPNDLIELMKIFIVYHYNMINGHSNKYRKKFQTYFCQNMFSKSNIILRYLHFNSGPQFWRKDLLFYNNISCSEASWRIWIK